MTLPEEKTWAILKAKQFLRDLLDPKKTPRVPKKIRQEAYWCLRHYPGGYDMDMAQSLAPEVFGKRKKNGK